MKFLWYLALSCFSAFLISPITLGAQSNNHVITYETWSDVTLKYHLSEKTWIGGDLGGRGIIQGQDWNSIYFRPTITHRLSREFMLAGSVASFNTFQKDLTNTHEIRLSQEVVASWPNFGWVKLYQRVRLEERLLFYEDSVPSGITVRARYALGAKSRNVKVIGPQERFFFGLAWEIFLPIGARAIELFSANQRFTGVIGYDLNDYLELQLNYMLQRSRVLERNDTEVSEHIIRLRLFYTFNPSPD